MKTVDVKFGSRIYRLDVIHVMGDGTIVTTRQSGLQAFCYTDGRADITIRDSRSDVLISEGIGSWHESTDEQPESGTRIRIPRGTRLWSIRDQRHRILDHALVTYAEEDDEDLSYRINYDGQIWVLGKEEI